MLEEVIGLCSIFGKETILGISSILDIKPNVRNVSSLHTSRQVGPDIQYKFPSEKPSTMGSVRFRVEEGSKFRQVVLTSGELQARISHWFILIFSKEIVLGISSDLAIRPGARHISSIHTSKQVSPNLRYKIPSQAVIAFEFVELNLTQIYASAFDSTNIKGSGNTGV